jgi:hypothetical protein
MDEGRFHKIVGKRFGRRVEIGNGHLDSRISLEKDQKVDQGSLEQEAEFRKLAGVPHRFQLLQRRFDLAEQFVKRFRESFGHELPCIGPETARNSPWNLSALWLRNRLPECASSSVAASATERGSDSPERDPARDVSWAASGKPGLRPRLQPRKK